MDFVIEMLDDRTVYIRRGKLKQLRANTATSTSSTQIRSHYGLAHSRLEVCYHLRTINTAVAFVSKESFLSVLEPSIVDHFLELSLT